MKNLSLLALCLGLAACVSEPAQTPLDVGRNLDAPRDAGPPLDGASDAGRHRDAGVAQDAGSAGDGTTSAADGDLQPVIIRRIGTHHITENWHEQALLAQVDPGFIRINITPYHFGLFVRDGDRMNWSPLDQLIQANANRSIFATVYPRHSDLSSTDTPQIVTTPEEYDDLQAWFEALGARYAAHITWWQLDNEINAGSSWPANRFSDYARQLAMLDTAIKARSSAARSVVAGITGAASTNIPNRVRQLLQAVVDGMATAPDAIDIHHHRPWQEGALLGARVAAYRSYLDEQFSLPSTQILVTENSTHFDQPPDREAQTIEEQAIYGIESLYSALGSGAQVCVLGVLQDREFWHDEALHRFSLNGLFYHPQKAYTGGNRQGPKLWAYTLKMVQDLTDGRPVDAFVRAQGLPNGVERIDVFGTPPYAVVWWQGATASHTLVLDIPAQAEQVTALNAIPNTGQAWPIADPQTAFSSEVLNAPDGRLELTLLRHQPMILLPR
jgi:hypothetical protein